MPLEGKVEEVCEGEQAESLGPEYDAMMEAQWEQRRMPGRSIEEYCFSAEQRGRCHFPESTAQPDRTNRSVTHGDKKLS